MSEQLTKAALIRMSWITELRRQGERQCHGSLRLGHSRVCAIGLLGEIADVPSALFYKGCDYDIGAYAGLTPSQVDGVTVRNDGGPWAGKRWRQHTFAEIADVVEGWFK
jgi:hypothetical protein